MSRLLRVLLALAGASLIVAAFASTSHACGVWSLWDQQQGWLVVFRSASIEAVHHPDEKTPRRIVRFSAAAKRTRDRDWRLMRLDSRRRVWLVGDKRVLSAKGGARGGPLLLGKRKIGRWSPTGVKIGRRSFRVSFGATYEPKVSPYSMIPDNDGRSVTVSVDGRVVLTGAAPGDRHCTGASRLIATYLAWREMFAGARTAP